MSRFSLFIMVSLDLWTIYANMCIVDYTHILFIIIQPALLKSPSLEGKKIAKCTLDKETQGLIKLIFDNDMFKDTLKKYDIGKIF